MSSVCHCNPRVQPAKRPRPTVQLPAELTWRIRRDACQLSEHLNALYHCERYMRMSLHIRHMRTTQSELGRLLHWISWERTWLTAGPEVLFYQGDAIRRALEGLRIEDRQHEQEDDH